MPKTPLNTTVNPGVKMRLDDEVEKDPKVKSVSAYVDAILGALCDLANDEPILDMLTRSQSEADEKGDRE